MRSITIPSEFIEKNINLIKNFVNRSVNSNLGSPMGQSKYLTVFNDLNVITHFSCAIENLSLENYGIHPEDGKDCVNAFIVKLSIEGTLDYEIGDIIIPDINSIKTYSSETKQSVNIYFSMTDVRYIIDDTVIFLANNLHSLALNRFKNLFENGTLVRQESMLLDIFQSILLLYIY